MLELFENLERHTVRFNFVDTVNGATRRVILPHHIVSYDPRSVSLVIPNNNEILAWIDRKPHHECDCPKVHGSQGTFCGDTYLTTTQDNAPHSLEDYSFATAAELVADPKLITEFTVSWLRKLRKNDRPHPPIPAYQTDEIRAVAAKMPMQLIAEQTVEPLYES